jgi:hypothetical protein
MFCHARSAVQCCGTLGSVLSPYLRLPWFLPSPFSCHHSSCFFSHYRFPFVCVSIGLTIGKIPTVGVVYNPIMNEVNIDSILYFFSLLLVEQHSVGISMEQCVDSLSVYL